MEFINDIQNPGSESIHIHNSNVDSEEFSMCHWTVGLIKINTLNMRTPISQWHAIDSHASEHSPSPIVVAISELETFVPSGRDFICM